MENQNKKYTFGLLVFILTEIMFFAGLLSSYWVLRSQLFAWPPLGQPRYPIYITAFNTIILLSSAWTFLLAEQKLKLKQSSFIWWLCLTALGGTLFLLLQGLEWWKLVQFGLHAASNIYGGIFYIIVGAHGLHVLFAVSILLYVIFTSRNRDYDRSLLNINITRKYWLFVVLIWPIIYVALYLL